MRIFLQKTYSCLVTLLVFNNSTTTMQPRHSSGGRCVRSKKHQPHQKYCKPSERDTKITKILNYTLIQNEIGSLEVCNVSHVHNRHATETTKIWLK